MRFRCISAGLAITAGALMLIPSAASAAGWTRYDRNTPYDPYAYYYEHPGYYPYYGSDYWKRPSQVKRRRFRYVQPRYWQSWGYKYPWFQESTRRHPRPHYRSHPPGTARPHTHRRHLY